MMNALPVGLQSPVGNGQGLASPSTFMSPTAPIGGTSGGSGNIGDGMNVLSMNLGGVNVNYDMGPSTGDLATQAYNFLGNSFNADSALVGNTIVGSQNFLSGFAAPVLSMAQDQQTFNDTVLPTMFQTLANQNYSIGSQAVQAEAGVAQASVNASSASAAEAQSGGGGFCFITTAVCEQLHEADDGPTLTKLRAFRDGYMQGSKGRQELVRLYYRTAPGLVAKIKARDDAYLYCKRLYDAYIAPAVAAIDRGDNLIAFNFYTQMVVAVREEVQYGTSSVR